ncbi:MAG: hypothetical protein ABIN37_00470, partial [Burkholderiaceae bacterium]
MGLEIVAAHRLPRTAAASAASEHPAEEIAEVELFETKTAGVGACPAPREPARTGRPEPVVRASLL